MTESDVSDHPKAETTTFRPRNIPSTTPSLRYDAKWILFYPWSEIYLWKIWIGVWRRGSRRNPRPATNRGRLFNHIVRALRIWALGAFYLIVSKGLIYWDFPIRLCHCGVNGSFMMKRMSFKRMIQSSYIVEPCNTIYKIDLPKKAFFE